MLNPNNKLFRWGPISACPLFMYYTIDPAFSKLKNHIGYCYQDSVIIFENNKVTWLLDDKTWYENSNNVLNGLILDQAKRNNYFALYDQRTRELEDILPKYHSLNTNKLHGKELLDGFKEFSDTYYDWWTIAISLELASSAEKLLGEKLKKYFPSDHPKEFNNAFAVLTSPLELSFYREEQLELIKIIDLPENKQDEALKMHQQKWHWILNSYLTGKRLPLEYFIEEFEKLKNADYQRIRQEIETYQENTKSEKEKIIKQYRIDEETQELIILVAEFGALQDKRKALNFKGDCILEVFVQNISAEFGLDSDEVKLLLPNEILQLLNTDFKKIINQRKQSFVIIANDQVIEGYNGEEARTIAAKFDETQDIDESMIHGVLASTGDKYYFRGTAKIILDIKDIGRVEEGDILVTTMTSPDFVIGMKKAGAIITDTGGVLSHAAIMSREFKKPCIVGTQIATKVIKDGDVVELHCGRGTVRIIKHSS